MEQNMNELSVAELVQVILTALERNRSGNLFLTAKAENRISFGEAWAELFTRGLGTIDIYELIRAEDK
jgi:hypothetical protein